MCYYALIAIPFLNTELLITNYPLKQAGGMDPIFLLRFFFRLRWSRLWEAVFFKCYYFKQPRDILIRIDLSENSQNRNFIKFGHSYVEIMAQIHQNFNVSSMLTVASLIYILCHVPSCLKSCLTVICLRSDDN